MFALKISIIIIITGNLFQSGAVHEINIALLEEWERSPSQWKAIVEWSQQLIRRDALIPDDYAIK